MSKIYAHVIFLAFCLQICNVQAQENPHAEKNERFHYFNEFQNKSNSRPEELFSEYQKDPEKFWAQCAEEIDWFRKWDTVLEWNMPYSSWFKEGQLNISYNCLDRHLAKNANKTALIWLNEKGDKRTISYNQLHQDVCRLANVLKSLGCQKGDRITIYMPMVPEAIVSMLACARIGAVHSVVFGGTGVDSLKEKIEDASSKIVITADGGYRRGKIVPYKELVDQALETNESVHAVLVLDHTKQKVAMVDGRDYSYRESVDLASVECPPAVLNAEDPFFVLYTSGTTGKAKGILHTTGGYLVGVHNTFKWVFDIHPDDIYWCTADVGWITGHSYVVYGPMSNCTTQVIYEGAFDYPNKELVWKVIEDEKVSIFYTAPTFIRTLMKWGDKNPAKYNLSSLRLLGSIGEPLNSEAWDWFYKEIGNKRCPILDTWFQTETGAFVIAPIPGYTPQKPGSVTQALPGYQVAVLSNEGEAARKGLLAITAPFPSMLRGVLNNPDLYYRNYWAKWNGTYYYAGDAASIDEDNYFRVQGRADEVILVSGHRISTAELESVINEHPLVAESAVVGIPDAIKGNIIIALIVLKEGCLISPGIEQQIQQYVAKGQGAYVRPYIVSVTPDLPKTKSGKILRRVLANLILDKPVGDLTTLENRQMLPAIQSVCQTIGASLAEKNND